MGITSISAVVYRKVPWLVNPNDDAKVNDEICFTQLTLQEALGKSDDDVNDETKYSDKEKLLVGLYTSYSLACQRVRELTGGEDGGVANSNRFLKKGKADVVEAEWGQVKASDGGQMIGTATQVKDDLKKETCILAVSMDLSLALCNEGCELSPADVGVGINFSCDFTDCDC